MNAKEELELRGYERCSECKCAIGDDWNYEPFTNKNAIKCPQCSNIILPNDDFEEVEQ